MADKTAPLFPELDAPSSLLALPSPTVFLDALTRVQRLQWNALLAWQQSLVDLQKELWDEWVCRWAGGAPIDA